MSLVAVVALLATVLVLFSDRLWSRITWPFVALYDFARLLAFALVQIRR